MGRYTILIHATSRGPIRKCKEPAARVKRMYRWLSGGKSRGLGFRAKQALAVAAAGVSLYSSLISRLFLLFSRHEQIRAASGSQEVHGQEASEVVVGTLRGFDQFMNLVIDNTLEINGNEKNDIGMVVIRGNSVVMIEALEPVGRTQ
ncbi:hypothetical protein H6P81_020852 [Aristolochia fimbriata]|uniref:Sm protein G n=1 Tax=Aristolochia fimbriata TaxID=158543 RepID=A0AAV7DYP7_ARIFI|nr:hypothetical protein H6P81_020852 [Aristolochia fimbriata]